MRRLILTAALTVLLAPLGLRADDAPSADAAFGAAAVDDLRDVQGRWQIVAMRTDGKAVPEANWKNLHWHFEGDKVTHYHGALLCNQGRFSLDRNADLPQLVVTYPAGRQQRQLFRIRGGVLEVAGCDGPDAPRGFTPERGCDTLFVLRRVVP